MWHASNTAVRRSATRLQEKALVATYCVRAPRESSTYLAVGEHCTRDSLVLFGVAWGLLFLLLLLLLLRLPAFPSAQRVFFAGCSCGVDGDDDQVYF